MEFETLQSESLKDMFVRKIEELIISGKLSIGEQLPPEREIALKMGISRTIVHSGLIELAVKGLIEVQPRRGTVVNDYRTSGTLAVLNSLMNYGEGVIDKNLLDSIIGTRCLIEVENARLSAVNRSPEDLENLNRIIDDECSLSGKNIDETVDLDFKFHHAVSMSTGNMIYPLIIKSFEPVYKNLTSKFFSDPLVFPIVLSYHKKLYSSIERRAQREAAAIMREILEHGEACLRRILEK